MARRQDRASAKFPALDTPPASALLAAALEKAATHRQHPTIALRSSAGLARAADVLVAGLAGGRAPGIPVLRPHRV